jgi:hypothetical protein
MVRNATKLYYPVKESIESILPIVDEFIIALGNCDPDDATLAEIKKIPTDKIKIIHTTWDLQKYPNGAEYAHQTDIAKNACKGDWLFYIQSDEVVHEKYLPIIKKRCEELVSDKEVEGLVFNYLHFWGDYSHHIISHAWYPKEIRIIRNIPYIHSWRDAQSFRWMPDFDGSDYFRKKNTRKLKVASLDAYIYHYGFVRPPRLMQKKQTGQQDPEGFNYGDLTRLKTFTETHPAVMKEFIEKFNWGSQLAANQGTKPGHKHERFKYRFLTFIEQSLLFGNQIGGFQNYSLLKK